MIVERRGTATIHFEYTDKRNIKFDRSVEQLKVVRVVRLETL